MARRAYRQDVGMVLKKTRSGGFFVVRRKVLLRQCGELFRHAGKRLRFALAPLPGNICVSMGLPFSGSYRHRESADAALDRFD
jgi:hypothetical protein